MMHPYQIPEIDIREVLPNIAALGFVKSLRKGETGIGFTLECLMGILKKSSKAKFLVSCL
jgi:MvaI/BcnI restriction endonuclease family